MCGRYAFFSPAEAVRRVFGVVELPDFEPRYNIAPTQRVATVREPEAGRRELAMLHWGLVPSWAKERAIGNRMINARAETLAEKPAFRRAYRRRRCIVLADGWYEWQAGADGKQPWFLRAEDRSLLGFAGLWEVWRDPATGEPLESCAIVTVDAPVPLADIHHRMPAVLREADYASWLDPREEEVEALARMLLPGDGSGLAADRVSRRVNDARCEGPELIQPVTG